MIEKMPMMSSFVRTLEFEGQCKCVSSVMKGGHAFQISRVSRSIIHTSCIMAFFCVAKFFLILRWYLTGTSGAPS